MSTYNTTKEWTSLGTGLGRYQAKPDPNRKYLRRELRPAPKQYTKNTDCKFKLRTDYDQRLWTPPKEIK